jgi:hypothetical protein
MRRIVMTAIASMSLAAPSAALAHNGEHHHHHRGRHHRHAHVLAFHAQAPAGATAPSTSTPSSESAGTVVSFSEGTLTLKLSDGSFVSGKVTERTEIECPAGASSVASAADFRGHDQGADNGRGDDNDRFDDRGQGGPGPSGDDHGDCPGHDAGAQTEHCEGALRGLLYRARATLRTAAAALTPPPLLAWAARGAGPGAPTVERIAELGAGGGAAAGIAGLVLKGSVVAVTAGALATGASVISLHERHAGQTRARASVSQPALAGPSAARVTRLDSSGPARGTSAALLGRRAAATSRERAAGQRHGASRGRDGPRAPHELTAVVLPSQAESERGVARRSDGSGSPRGRDGREGFDTGRRHRGSDIHARDADSHPHGSGDAGPRLEGSTPSRSSHRGDSSSEDASTRSEDAQPTHLESNGSQGRREP